MFQSKLWIFLPHLFSLAHLDFSPFKSCIFEVITLRVKRRNILNFIICSSFGRDFVSEIRKEKEKLAVQWSNPLLNNIFCALFVQWYVMIMWMCTYFFYAISMLLNFMSSCRQLEGKVSFLWVLHGGTEGILTLSFLIS